MDRNKIHVVLRTLSEGDIFTFRAHKEKSLTMVVRSILLTCDWFKSTQVSVMP